MANEVNEIGIYFIIILQQRGKNEKKVKIVKMNVQEMKKTKNESQRELTGDSNTREYKGTLRWLQETINDPSTEN